jgi:hypothetical protein
MTANDINGSANIGVVDANSNPKRIVKTDGFDRLFKHYTGLQGDELMQYLQDFQNKALNVYSLRVIDTGLSVWLYP